MDSIIELRTRIEQRRRASLAGVIVSALASFALSTECPAALSVITLSTTDSVINGRRNQGWWSDTVANSATNPKYLIGSFGSLPHSNPRDIYRSHLSFNLGEISEKVETATLRLTRLGSAVGKTTDRNGKLIFNTRSGITQSISLYDVSTDATVLNSTSGINLPIFNDLGTGISLGTFDRVQMSNPTGIEEFQLNPDAIDLINSTTGHFSIGMSIDGVTSAQDNFLFGPGIWNSSVQELVLTLVPEPTRVPEPSIPCCLAACLAAVSLSRRRGLAPCARRAK